MKICLKTVISPLLILELASSTWGFMPLQPQTTKHVRATSPLTPVGAGSPSSSTVLHMNLLDRFVRVAKSNLNSIAAKVEDPEKIMNQAMIDMQVRGCCVKPISAPTQEAHCSLLELSYRSIVLLRMTW